MFDMRTVMAQRKTSEKRLLAIAPDLPKSPGIYVFFRTDEAGIKYAYVGQAKNLLSRCVTHLLSYQAIDLSIKKHGLYNAVKKPCGYQLKFKECPVEQLDENERKTVVFYANKGYQMRNKTTGGQETGKQGLLDNKPSKGYWDGVKQGHKKCKEEVKEYFDKYLDYVTKSNPECFKKPKRKGELPTLKDIYVKKYNEFQNWLEENENEV